jgi:hypothetical protein
MNGTNAPVPGLGPWWVRYRLVLYLLLGLAGVDAAVARHRDLWRTYDPDDYRARVDNCRAHPCDLLLVGGSAVSEGIAPAFLAGLCRHGHTLARAYNLGLPGATIAEVWHGVRHGVTSPPRLLVYGMTASDLNDKRGEPHGARALMDLEDVALWCRLRPSAAGWCVGCFAKDRVARLWQLFYHANAIRLWAADRAESFWPGCCAAAAAEAREGLRYSGALAQADGYAPQPAGQNGRLDHLKARGELTFRAHTLENYQLGQYLRYLHRLLDWAARHGVEIVLVDMPVSADLEERLHPQAFARYRAALVEVERARCVAVLRASRQALGLTECHFADLVHLNVNGMVRLSTWLRQALADPGRACGGSNS